MLNALLHGKVVGRARYELDDVPHEPLEQTARGGIYRSFLFTKRFVAEHI